jgi:hypothetical protein
MRHYQLLDRAQFSRAAIHLIQTHGRQAGAVATKRAIHLQQCGEDGGADTWRKIGDFVRAIEAGNKPGADAPELDSAEHREGREAAMNESESERSLALAG